MVNMCTFATQTQAACHHSASLDVLLVVLEHSFAAVPAQRKAIQCKSLQR